MRNMIVTAAVTAACLASASTYAADEITEKTTVGGKAYIDLTHADTKKNNVAQDNNGYGIDVTRFYVVIDHVFDNMWSADVTTDFNYAGKSTETQETQVFIKKAYVQAKLDDAFILRVGSADLPWVPFVEGLYGYRYLEKVMTDRTGFATSADWGLHAGGKFADGMVNYAISAVNGRGYKDYTRSKTMDLEGRLSAAPVNGLTVAAGYRTGKLGQDVESNPAENTATRADALVAYAYSNFRVGAEYFSAKNYSATLVQSPTTTDKANGYSLWGSAKFTPDVAGFARFENVKPSKTLSNGDKNQYWTAGVSYQPRKNIDLALAYKNTKQDTGANTTKTNEIGVWSQVAF